MAAAAGCHCRVDGATSGDDNELLPDTHAQTNAHPQTFSFSLPHTSTEMKARVVFVLWFRWLLFLGGRIEEAEETSLVVIEVIDDELLVADWMCLVGGQTETTLLGTRRNESNESNWISLFFLCVVGYRIPIRATAIYQVRGNTSWQTEQDTALVVYSALYVEQERTKNSLMQCSVLCNRFRKQDIRIPPSRTSIGLVLT